MEMKMMTNTIRLMTAAGVIGVGVIGVMSEAAAQVPRYGYLRSHQHYGRTYRPPEGQIYQRAFRNAPTREERARQDFQLDGTFNGNCQRTLQTYRDHRILRSVQDFWAGGTIPGTTRSLR
jgi:hypothetical protein